MRTPSSLLILVLAASGCGSSDKTITVGGRVLKVAEENFGTSGTMLSSAKLVPFCQPLATNQFEVIISDFAMCSGAERNESNTLLFHSTDEYNMRLIMPSDLMRNSNGTFKKNTFNVAPTSGCRSAGGQPATAFFSHNTGGKYDVNIEAGSGSISVTAYDGQTNLQGEYDLMFNTDHVLGTFDTTYCSGLNAQYSL